MTRACAQTTGPRIRMSRHDGASARCSVSNRPDPPSVSCPLTPPSTTHSTSSATSPPAARFASSETKRSGRGEPPPRPEHELGLPNCAGPNSVRVTGPSGLHPSCDRRHCERSNNVGDVACKAWLADKRRNDRLIPPGRRLANAEAAVAALKGELEPELMDFVTLSGRAAGWRQRMTAIAAAAFFLLAD